MLVAIGLPALYVQRNWMAKEREAYRDSVSQDEMSAATELAGWLQAQKLQASADEGQAPVMPSFFLEGMPNLGEQGLEWAECVRRVINDEGDYETCPICFGVGGRIIKKLDEADRRCPNCNAMGRWKNPDTGHAETCPRCDGSGLIQAVRR